MKKRASTVVSADDLVGVYSTDSEIIHTWLAAKPWRVMRRNNGSGGGMRHRAS